MYLSRVACVKISWRIVELYAPAEKGRFSNSTTALNDAFPFGAISLQYILASQQNLTPRSDVTSVGCVSIPRCSAGFWLGKTNSFSDASKQWQMLTLLSDSESEPSDPLISLGHTGVQLTLRAARTAFFASAASAFFLSFSS